MNHSNLKGLGICRASFLHNHLLLKWFAICTLVLSEYAEGNTHNHQAVTKPDAHLMVQNHPTPPNIDPNGTVITLRPTVISQYQDLTIRLIKIEDSRCPVGENCFSAGQIRVTLEISDDHTAPTSITLTRKRKAKSIFALGYAFRLLDVEPHPKKGRHVAVNEQKIKIEIINLSSE